MTDSTGDVHTSLVISKTKVAPTKHLTIPRLQLCGAYFLGQLLYHVQQVFQFPLSSIHSWTDSTIVLNWLVGNPRRFKTYVGNGVSYIVDFISPGRWNHVNGIENPADCASRGLFRSELLENPLWWNGSTWLKMSPADWPRQSCLPPNDNQEERKEVNLNSTTQSISPVISLDKYSSFTHLIRITTWKLRFTKNCRPNALRCLTLSLSTEELISAECYWNSLIQNTHFKIEIQALSKPSHLCPSSSLLPLNPILDANHLLRVGGRLQNSRLSYSVQYPLILHGKYPVTKLIIWSEHIRLLHAGPTLLTASLCRRCFIVGCRIAIRSITRGCVFCQRNSVKPQWTCL